MKTKSSTLLKPCRSSGLTLIEVVVGLALLATLLVSILTAYGRHVRQIRQAQRQLDAVRAADHVLCQWFAKLGNGPPASEQGICGEEKFNWRIVPLPQLQQHALGVQLMRLEVFDPRDLSSENTQKALVSVDVVVPQPNEESATGTDE